MTSTWNAPPRHPLLACAEAIERSLKSVSDVEPGFMPLADKREALAWFTRLEAELAATRLRIIAAADDVAEATGCRDVAAWLTATTRTAPGANARDQRLARDLAERWTRVGAALVEGRVNTDQARVIVKGMARLIEPVTGPAGQTLLVPGDVLAAAEAKLVELAADHGPRELGRLAEKILEVVAPDLFEDHERRLLEQAERNADRATRLSFKRRGDGATDLRARIPDAVATRLQGYLESFTSPRHQNTTGGGGRCAGSDPNGGPGATEGPAWMLDPATGRRLPADRLRGIAFCALLEGIDPKAMPAKAGAATTLVITMALADLQQGLGVGTLPDGSALSAGQVRRLACTAGLIPTVLGRKSEVLDLGRADRFFSGKQKLAKVGRAPALPGRGLHRPGRLDRGTPPPGLVHRRPDRPLRPRLALPLAPPPGPRRPLHRGPPPQRRRSLPSTTLSRAPPALGTHPGPDP